MAPRERANNDAQDTVFENFGLTAEDLGVDQDDDFNNQNDDNDDDNNQDNRQQRNNQSDDDDNDDGLTPDPLREAIDRNRERVSHTREQVRQRPQKQLPKTAEVKADQKGNLVDAKGQIVARAGAEARLYQRAQKATQDAQQARQTIEAIRTDLSGRLERAVEIAREQHQKVQEYEARDQQIKALGLTPQDQLEALQYFVEGKSNPVQLIKKLLTKAAASGINMSELGINAGGFDVKALTEQIQQQITREMEPLRKRQEDENKARERTAAEQRELEETTREVNSFFARNKDAVPYIPVLEQLMRDPRTRHLSLAELWLNLKDRVNLSDQRQRQQNSRERSIPNGRRRPIDSIRDDDEMSRGNEMATVDQSYDQILRDVMKQHNVGR